MKHITGFEMAQAVQKQMRIHFSMYLVTDIEINDQEINPELIINVQHKLEHDTYQLRLVAERQENNPNNIHFLLLNSDNYFIKMYAQDRSQYVKRNHQVGSKIENARLIPENLYLIQDADGRPGVDFIETDLICDAINLIILISKNFKTII